MFIFGAAETAVPVVFIKCGAKKASVKENIYNAGD